MDIAVRNQRSRDGYHMQYRITTVLHAVMTFMLCPQLKLVLDIATSEGCKAELIRMVVTSRDRSPTKTVTYVRNNLEVSWLEIES